MPTRRRASVAERHALHATSQRAKTNQAFPAADIKQMIARRQARRVEHAITHTNQLRENLSPTLGIAAETTLRQPLRPPIAIHPVMLCEPAHTATSPAPQHPNQA